MIIQNPEDYRLVKFEKSHLQGKKYNAVLVNKKTGRERRVPFGALGYEQYRDSTGLALYRLQDHGDINRRRLYKLRHAREEMNKFSSGYFAMKYLW